MSRTYDMRRGEMYAELRGLPQFRHVDGQVIRRLILRLPNKIWLYLRDVRLGYIKEHKGIEFHEWGFNYSHSPVRWYFPRLMDQERSEARDSVAVLCQRLVHSGEAWGIRRALAAMCGATCQGCGSYVTGVYVCNSDKARYRRYPEDLYLDDLREHRRYEDLVSVQSEGFCLTCAERKRISAARAPRDCANLIREINKELRARAKRKRQASEAAA